jgi:hypothetical protein
VTGDNSNADGNDCEDSAAPPDRSESEDSLPASLREEATRLTRHARRTGDDAAAERYRAERESLLAEYDYTARVRDADATLVLHPEEWIEDGTVRPDRIENTDEAVEISLDGPDDEWPVVDRHNCRVVDRIAEEHGEAHAATAEALADYAGNHHESRIEHLTDEQLDRFRTEYFPRNAWPSDEQRAQLAESVAIAREISDALEE